ncbi:hypothetical protein Neosp_000300 [[Neocosmospora] mangrovei]
MGRIDLCSTSLRSRYARRHVDDDLFASICRLGEKITIAKERIWCKLSKARAARKRQEYEEGLTNWLAEARDQNRSHPGWSRDESPIQYREPAPAGRSHRIVSSDHRVWTITEGKRLMTK